MVNRQSERIPGTAEKLGGTLGHVADATLGIACAAVSKGVSLIVPKGESGENKE